jgi:hypothetical protein
VCAASGGTVSGIELASGWEIRERIKAIVKVKPKRLPYKRIGSLQPLFFPLSTILCATASTTRSSSIPTPEDARTAVIDAIEERSSLAGFGQTLALPDVEVKALPRDGDAADGERRRGKRQGSRSYGRREGLPAIIRSAVERRGERVIDARVKRLKVVLIAD